jgi:phosphoesterase RecJ-like protein
MISAKGHALFAELLESVQQLVLTTHVLPDGDAIGSQISLARFLLSRGKKVRIANQDPTPETLQFICHESVPIELYRPAVHDALLRGADLVLLLDNSAPDRLGEMEAAIRSSTTLCIDHHPSRDAPWTHQILDEEACATAVMVYELTRRCGWQPDQAAAESIYVGLATDTGFFRFNSTNSQAHAVAAELLALGVRPAKIYQAIYERNTPAYTRLLGHALSQLSLEANGALAAVHISRELIDDLDAEHVDTSEITTALLAMDAVQVALLFRELADGRIKVSLRSKGAVDVHKLASEFGGGGHRNASGIVCAGGLRQVSETVTARVRALLGRQGPP